MNEELDTLEDSRRSKIRILVDIIRLIERRGGLVKPTHILYGANLSHKRLNRYLTWLETKEFIEKVSKGNHIYYRVTDKGRKFVVEFKKIEQFSEAFGVFV